MARPLRISEIHEFAEVGSVPEAAVTDEILRHVAELDERKQLEVWIQEIIHSSDNTPHTSTEIVDIISTRVTVNGSPTFTAFILKGKSSKKITSRNVSHQIIRLRRLTGLGLAVFAAVGDIHDDVYEQFTYEAQSLGCRYLVMTSHDLARLFIAYGKICGEDGLPFENGKCPKGHSQRPEIELHYKVREEFQWELLSLRDVSFGLAKRLSATVLTDKHYTQDTLRAILAEVVPRIRSDPYVRNRLVGAQWGKSPAHVVWVHLGLDMGDVKDFNWICMACWIDPDLEKNYRPSWHYDELYDDIMIKWKSDYPAMKRFLSEHTGSKHQVIQCVEGILEKVQPILIQLDQAFTGFRQGAVTELSLTELVQKHWEDADNLYSRAVNCPLAPPECVDYRQQFQNIMASFHDLFLYYTSDVFLTKRTTADRTWLFNRKLANLKETLQKLDYEREKLL